MLSPAFIWVWGEGFVSDVTLEQRDMRGVQPRAMQVGDHTGKLLNEVPGI